MTTLGALWLPTLLSTIFVFPASSLLHIVIPIHKADGKGLPDEQDTLPALRNAKIPPGQCIGRAISRAVCARLTELPGQGGHP